MPFKDERERESCCEPTRMLLLSWVGNALGLATNFPERRGFSRCLGVDFRQFGCPRLRRSPGSFFTRLQTEATAPGFPFFGLY